MPKADGVTPRNRPGVREHHREVGQRASFDEFDTIMEHSASDAGRFMDDRREQQRAIQSEQGMVSTMRSSREEKWGTKLEAVHSIWPWIAERAGFFSARFEVGRVGKTELANVQGMMFVEGILWNRKRAGAPLGKLTCMWDYGVYERQDNNR